jgi:hypothetical protein
MPLAQAASQIGCERSPSLARPGLWLTRFGLESRARGPGPIGDRNGSFRAQAKVVRDGPRDRFGSHPKINPFGRELPRALRWTNHPGAANRRPRGSTVQAGRQCPHGRRPRSAIRTGPPVSDQRNSFPPISRAQGPRAPPRTDAAPVASGPRLRGERPSRAIGADRAVAAAASLRLVSHHETT